MSDGRAGCPVRGEPRGFSLLEVLVVVAIVMVLASMAIPNIQRSRILANEAAALESLITLNNECFVYWTEHDGYPPVLTDLWPDATIAKSIDANAPSLATATKAGYVFAYRPGSMDSSRKILTYSITAIPVSPGATGTRSFFTDQSGPIRASETGEATPDSPSVN